MASCEWSRSHFLIFLAVFSVQAVIVLRLASQLEERDNVVCCKKADSISIHALLSRRAVTSQIASLRNITRQHNLNPVIINLDKFGNLSTNAPIFVVQLHDRIVYIEALIESLRRVPEINSSLIVLSHDVYSDEINQAVRKIDFVRYIQIFYSYSQQLYPSGFPGPDRKTDRIYHRKPKLAQIKLHWIWKTTQVFRDMPGLRHHHGPKIFLEEDHYVAPDILHTLSRIQQIQSESCPSCIIILGGYPKRTDTEYPPARDLVKRDWFFASGNNMGMVLEHSFWQKLYGCGEEFCTTDDYNWDWTLQHLNNRCFGEPLQILKPDAPRVFHVGDCGTHSKSGLKCSRIHQTDTIVRVQKALWRAKAELFPKRLRVEISGNLTMADIERRATPALFGGWADPRDRQLCQAILDEN